MNQQQEENLTEEEIEQIEKKAREKLRRFGAHIDLEFESKAKIIKDIAEEFHKANLKTGKSDKEICREIAKGLHTQITEERLSYSTILRALPPEYKRDTRGRKGRPKIGKKELDEEDLLTKEVQFLRHAVGLSPEQIFEMPIGEMLVKMEPYYGIELQAFSNHDVHLQAKILDYMMPLVRKMIEMTEAKRTALKSQEESGIGGV